MTRPRRHRRVCFNPDITYFKPAGIRKAELDEVILSIDELEAIRLKDFEGIDQSQAAESMHISQPTFHRLIIEARKKLADSVINGKALKIEGGNFKFAKNSRRGRRF